MYLSFFPVYRRLPEDVLIEPSINLQIAAGRLVAGFYVNRITAGYSYTEYEFWNRDLEILKIKYLYYKDLNKQIYI